MRLGVGMRQQQRDLLGRRQEQSQAGARRCRCLRAIGVSPVRVSTVMGKPISVRGTIRLRCNVDSSGP